MTPRSSDSHPVKIYRSVLHDTFPPGFQTTPSTGRAPVYVPNVVDNLWEWQRPDDMPSRRRSVFASPTPELARAGGPSGGHVYMIHFHGSFKACQLRRVRNSRSHAETIDLPILLYKLLGDDWLWSSTRKKAPAGQLWLPCLAREEVEHSFEEVAELRSIRAEIESAVRYWDDARLLDADHPDLDPDGEVFFEAPSGYTLLPIE